MILDHGAALGQRLAGQVLHHHRRIRQAIEQRGQVLVEERQPVLHAGETLLAGDRGIKRIVARRRTESGEIALPEPRDVSGVSEISLAGCKDELRLLAGSALGGGIEGADAFQRVAEEIEPDGLRRSRRENVEDAAAHGIFADLAHRRHALETGGCQRRGDVVHAHGLAGFGDDGLPGDLVAVAACAAGWRSPWSG
jgi:hypothetical protein